MGDRQYGIDETRLNEYAEQIREVAQKGVEIGIVIGGGNIFRGLSGASKGFDRVKGDQMGMLATVINSLALSSALTSMGQKNRVFTAFRMEPVGELYTKWRAIEAMENGEIALIAGGTGNPFFTTDTASALEVSRSKLMPCSREPVWTVYIRPIRRKILLPLNFIPLLLTRSMIGDSR